MSSRFISESDIAAKKQKLKEAWNSTRTGDDPEDPPEEPPPDNRTLYHKLEEQKLKKQEEYDDAHRLKNMVRGLEDDEVHFLDLVDRSKIEQERRVRSEESTALSEFRKRRAEMEIARTDELVSTVAQSGSASGGNKIPKNSQKALLSGAIKKKAGLPEQDREAVKRKRSNSDDTTEAPDAPTPSSATDSSQPTVPAATEHSLDGIPPIIGPNGYLRLAGLLPGLGNYTDSSDSDNSSDSDDPKTCLIMRRHPRKSKRGCGGGGCC